MNLAGVDMKLNWAQGIQPKQDTSKHFHIFVGDLSPDIEVQQLRDAFISFGHISDCKIIRDPQTSKSKGYGFVSFVRKEDAESAIATMNGQWIGGRAVRTNWASRKPLLPVTKDASLQKPLIYDEIFGQSSPTNTTVYCGGILSGLSEELIQRVFNIYGSIQEIRVFKDKGYAFIRFSTKESAAHAIVTVHGTEINGHLVKCSWGKETPDSAMSPSAIPTVVLAGNTPTALAAAHQYAGQPFTQTYVGQVGYTWTLPQNLSQFQQNSLPIVPQGYNYNSLGMGMPVQWPAVQMVGGNTSQQPANIQLHQGLVGYPVTQCN